MADMGPDSSPRSKTAPAKLCPWTASAQSTLGVEWEIALVDQKTKDLTNKAPELLQEVYRSDSHLLGGKSSDSEKTHPFIKEEFLQNTVEIVTGVCKTVSEATHDIEKSLLTVINSAEKIGCDIFSAGTHPFSNSLNQEILPKKRYAELVERTQWWGKQAMYYGVHTHVGIDDVNKIMPVINGLKNFYPHLLALSASSPFWNGENTGYASQRTMMFQQLPTAGFPWSFDTWQEFERYAASMIRTGIIDNLSELRADIRPVPHLGTVEVRICDGVPTLAHIQAIAALTQCLVEYFSRAAERGEHIRALPEWFGKENKWRAARYGLDATIIVAPEGDEEPVTNHILSTIGRLEPIAEDLGCTAELAQVATIMNEQSSYRRQLVVAEQAKGDLSAVVADLAAQLRH